MSDSVLSIISDIKELAILGVLAAAGVFVYRNQWVMDALRSFFDSLASNPDKKPKSPAEAPKEAMSTVFQASVDATKNLFMAAQVGTNPGIAPVVAINDPNTVLKLKEFLLNPTQTSLNTSVPINGIDTIAIFSKFLLPGAPAISGALFAVSTILQAGTSLIFNVSPKTYGGADHTSQNKTQQVIQEKKEVNKELKKDPMKILAGINNNYANYYIKSVMVSQQFWYDRVTCEAANGVPYHGDLKTMSKGHYICTPGLWQRNRAFGEYPIGLIDVNKAKNSYDACCKPYEPLSAADKKKVSIKFV